MRFVLMIEGQEGVTWEEWVALAGAAEKAGLEGLFRSDHYTMIQGTPGGALDAWTTISGLAAITKNLRLGTLVSPMTFRHPSLIARIVTSADHISGGRIELGIGAGWFELEHTQNGFAFPDLKTRFDMLVEQVEIIVQSWTNETFDYDGAHYSLKAQSALPHPVQKPHVPIIIGGAGKRRSIELAARFANEYNSLAFGPISDIHARRKALDKACADIGRDPSTIGMSLMGPTVIGKTPKDLRDRTDRALDRMSQMITTDEARAQITASPLFGTFDELAERFSEFEKAGIGRMFLQHIDRTDLEAISLYGELAKELA